MNAISLTSVSVTLDGNRVVDAVELGVEAGEWVTLIGPNGAGKSTLLKILLGLIGATSGKATVFDLDVAHQGIAIREPRSTWELAARKPAGRHAG